MLPFLMILMIAVLGFAHSFFILAINENPDEPFTGDTIFKAIIYSYRSGLGDFDSDGFDTESAVTIWIFWSLNTIIILLILLNALIAIMGDTFD